MFEDRQDNRENNVVQVKNFPKGKLEVVNDDIIINSIMFSSFIPDGGWRNRWHGVYTIPKIIEVNDEDLTIKAKIAGCQNFNKHNPVPDRYKRRVRNPQTDFRLANCFFSLQDIESGMTFGYFVTNHALYTFYGKLQKFESHEEHKGVEQKVQNYTIDNFGDDIEYKLFKKHLSKDIFRQLLSYLQWKTDSGKIANISIFDGDEYQKWNEQYIQPADLTESFNDYVRNDSFEYYSLWIDWKRWTDGIESGNIPKYTIEKYMTDPLYVKSKNDITVGNYLLYKTFLEWRVGFDSYGAVNVDDFEKFLDFRYTPKRNGMDEWKKITSFDDYNTFIDFIVWKRKLKIFQDKENGEPILKINQIQSDVNYDGHFMSVKKVAGHSGCNPFKHLYDVAIKINNENKSVSWYVSGEKVFSVLSVGHRTEQEYRVYDTGGYTEQVDIRNIKIYFGCGQFLDALEPDVDWRKVMTSEYYLQRSALVKMEDMYYNPVNNFMGELEMAKNGYFASETNTGDDCLFGQGSIMRLSSLKIMLQK